MYETWGSDWIMNPYGDALTSPKYSLWVIFVVEELPTQQVMGFTME
ncbi:MAG: hypothetical protein CM15mV12_3420 [uncultured marine virus]|nr:MAG: hypothetical protein CM15mV12_3420 [uncultured marine virus]